jgi:hypothetical protein
MLQFFQAVLVGFIAFGINALLGSVLFALLRGYVKERVKEWLYASISEYIRVQLELSVKNANETAKALKPIIVAIVNEVMKDFQKGQSEGMVKIPFLGRVPASFANALIERFLGGGSKSKSNEGGNPFA